MVNYLNPEQQAFVDSECHVIVTACPGSGKTRALTFKIANELEKLKDSKQFVVALTYTNRAADEIQNRIDRMSISTERLWSGTIHSFCLEWILRPYCGYSERLKNGFAVIDEYRQEKILNDLKIANGLSQYDQIYVRWGRGGRIAQDSPIKQHIADEYDAFLIGNKLIDFELILFLSFCLLRDKVQISKTLSRIFNLICVDEFQDTSDLQYAIICNIIRQGAGQTRIVLVGDPDQAIFESLGGVAKSPEEISAEIGGWQIQQLNFQGNYRSTQRIIDYYRYFQTTNIDIVALGEIANEDCIITYNDQIQHENLSEEIARLIQEALQQGIPENEICVIAPQWWMLTSMARSLKGILPDVQFDAPGLSPLPRRPENFWFKVARLILTEPSPNLYFARKKWVGEVIAEFNQFTRSPLINSNGVEHNTRSLLRILNQIALTVTEEDGILYLEECFNELMLKLGINLETYPMLNEHFLAFFEGINHRFRKREFQNISRSKDNFKNMFRHATGILVNTCQGIKGEEFHTVISYGLLKGYIPHTTIHDPEAAAIASNRLLYVICSRAKKSLHLIAETGRNRDVNEQLSSFQFQYDN